MRKENLPAALALIGGAVGLGLRRWQLATGFEPDTGLAIPGTTAATLLMALSLLVAMALVALILPRKGSWPFDVAFSAPGNQLYVACVTLGAFLLLGAAVMEMTALPAALTTAREAEANGVWLATFLPPLRVLFCLVGAVSTLAIGRNTYRALGKGEESMAGLGLCLMLCVWLVSVYQKRAADPVTQDYLYEVFAVVFSLMGLYYFTGWSFQTGRLRRSLFCFLMAVYFSLVTLADPHTMAQRLLFGFNLLFFTAHALLLLQEHPAEDREAPAETEDIENG